MVLPTLLAVCESAAADSAEIAPMPSSAPAEATETNARPLNNAKALRLLEPFYAALTATSAAQIAPLLKQVTDRHWHSCSGIGNCEDRATVIARWSQRVERVPDMQWTLQDVLISRNTITVRAEGTGTPSGDFLGVPHSGRSFRILAIDIHTVVNGRILRTWHVEDWGTAIRQLSGNQPAR